MNVMPSKMKKVMLPWKTPGLAGSRMLPSGSKLAGPSAESLPFGKSGPGVHVPVEDNKWNMRVLPKATSAVRPQDLRSDLETCRVDQDDNCAPRARPFERGRIVYLRIGNVGGINCQNLTVGKKAESLFG